MAQAQKLMAEAEEARKRELASVIADIKATMKQYGITASDLGGPADVGKKGGKSKAAPTAKYRGPKGELWAGTGRGPKPAWVRAVLAAGGDIESYRT
jgi:DNA-binding protein H-NS